MKDGYFRAVHAGSGRLVDEVLQETGMKERVRVTVAKSMAGCDDRNEILIQAL
jgi:hypothetical protein